MRADYKSIRDEVVAMSERYAVEVSRLYDGALVEIAALMKGVELDEGKPFTFDDYGLQDKVDEIMDNLENAIMRKVGDGVVSAYALSYKNCEALVKRAIGETASEKVKKALMPKVHAKKAAQAFMRNVPSISGKLWNGETLALMTSAVEDSIRQGMSATKIASRIKQYLNDPDDWHRRFRYKAGEDKDGNPIYRRRWKKREYDEATGKYKWVDHKPGEPHPGHVGGPGAYRSSYKNALRYARTTTNIAYRTADYDQYQEMPFVVGIEIRLSNNHPVVDICDTLTGAYPKEFKWTGWHPNCRCYQVPILANHEEVDKMVDKILDDEDPSSVVCEDTVSEMPSNFTSWLNANEQRVGEAVSRGTLPYFLKDNGTIDEDGLFHLKDFTAPKHELTILEKAQMRHAARTDEEVADIQARADARQKQLKEYALTKTRANNFLGMVGDWHEVDFSSLQDLFAQVQGKSFYRSDEMSKLKQAVADIKIQIQAQQAAEKALSDVIPDVHKWHTQFSISELQGVKDAVAKKIADYEKRSSRLQDLKDNMEFEAKWVRDHKKYSTWEVAEKAYLKKAQQLADDIAWQDIDDLINTAKSYGHVSTSYDAILQKAITMRGMKVNAKDVEKYLLDAELERKKWADIDRRLATIKGFKSKSAAYNDLVAKATQLRNAEASVDDVEAAIRDAEAKKDALWKKYGKKKISSEFGEKTLDELKKEMGADLPKTLEHLDDAIKAFSDVNPDFEAVRDEIQKQLFKLFKDNDFGMDISGALLENVLNYGFFNTFQSGSSDGYCGSSSTTGKIPIDHGRLSCAHILFGLGKDLAKDQLERRQYEKYGHLLDHDKLDAYLHNRTHYGTNKAGTENQVQVRFKKDRVVCTWTFNDSLCERYQPSLVSDPKIESLDNISTSKKPVSTDPTKLYEWQKKKYTSYVELQYHGDLTMDDVEDIVFARNPELVISKDLIGKLQQKGIKLFYYDGSAIVEYQ